MAIALRGLRPEVRNAAEWCLQVAQLNGIPVTVTSATRTWQEQSALRARYERCLARGPVRPDNPDRECRYPANKPGDSAHQFGLAFDSYTPPEYSDVWAYVRRLVGFYVPDHDLPHAEVPGWREYVRPFLRGA